MSNFGPSIGNRGILAPGVNINSTLSGGKYIKMSDTSCAAPFVTGTIALLWSLYPDATTEQVIYAIRMGSNIWLNKS
jgi:subtilisin family serine protease